MDENMLYLSLVVIVVIAIVFFRGGHLLLSLVTLIVGGWLYYNHDKDIDISDTIYERVDDSVRGFEQKDISDIDKMRQERNIE